MEYLNLKIKRFLFFLLVYCGGAFSAQAQIDSLKCNLVHTGTFAYRNDSLQSILIVRKKNRQEEHNKATNTLTKYRVKWLTGCSYRLKQTWSNSRQQRKQNGSTSVVVINRADKDGYQFTCRCENETDRAKYSGIVYRIE